MCPAVGMCTCVAPGMAAARSREWDGGVRRSAPPLMMVVLRANGGERGVLVVGPQAWQEPDGGGQGCRGHGRIEQRRNYGAGVVADLEGHGGAHGLGKQANSPLRRASREPAQHVRSGTGQESGHAALREPTRRSGDEDDSVRLAPVDQPEADQGRQSATIPPIEWPTRVSGPVTSSAARTSARSAASCSTT